MTTKTSRCPADPADALSAHISDKSFPCVGAKSALASGGLTMITAGALSCPRADPAILSALEDNAEAFWRDADGFQSLAVLFPESEAMDERTFESQLWARLQGLIDCDAARDMPHDPEVSDNPADHNYALSLGGHGYFVVGLHPAASRPARRFAHPALVFNLQAQFEALRQQGRFDRMHDAIMERDVALAGSPNPMLADFGKGNAAAQFSGRIVGDDWECPLEPPARTSKRAKADA